MRLPGAFSAEAAAAIAEFLGDVIGGRRPFLIGEGAVNIGAHLRPLLARGGEHAFGFGDQLITGVFVMGMSRHAGDIRGRQQRGNQPVWKVPS
jgi:hypothetical protein